MRYVHLCLALLLVWGVTRQNNMLMQEIKYDIGAEVLMPTVILHNFAPLGPFWIILGLPIALFTLFHMAYAPGL